MGTFGNCCCCSNECGSYCVGRNPCVTTLSISGNHPATLKIPISYSNYEKPICGLYGTGSVDRSASTNHTINRLYTAKYKAYDQMHLKHYVCCAGGTPQLALEGDFEVFQATSGCQRADLRYEGVTVKIYSDSGYSCGAWIEVCLTFRRFTFSQYNYCRYLKFTGDTYNTCVTPFGEDYSGTFNDECNQCYSSNSTNPTYDSSIDPKDQGYVTAPTCSVPTDTDWSSQTLYNIYRRKWVPNLFNIGCVETSVTLTESNDITSNSFCCSQAPITLSCILASDVIYSGLQSLTAENCGETTCGSTTYPAHNRFGTFYDQDSNGYLIGYFAEGTYCTLNRTGSPVDYGNLFSGNQWSCWDKAIITNRYQGATVQNDLTNNTLLFGELHDPWTLTLNCSHS
jgi:hypothetical protein